MKKADLIKLLKEANIQPEDLIKILSTDKKDDLKYKCSNCSGQFKSEKRKRKCPTCKSTKIAIVEEKQEEKADYICKTGINLQNRRSVNEDGKIAARSEQVDLNRIKNIKALDKGDYKKDSEEFDKKIE